jgi:phosphatidylglycerophosphate synthase
MEQPQLNTLVCLPTAGDGKTSFSPVKLKIYGLTLLERTLRALERAGVNSATVLAGTQHEAVEDLLKKTAPWGMEIIVSQKSDGKEALQALQNGSKEGWVFLREPLVLDPALLRRLVEVGNGDKATVASTPGGEVVFAGTGVSLETAPSITIDPCNSLCHPVRNEEDLRRVKKALRRSLVKPTDGWVSRNLNRPVSISISWVLAHTSITPNQFTVFTGLLGVACGLFAAQGGYWGFLASATLFHLTSVLDGVDGELARLKFKASPFGQWLDTLVDNSTYIFALSGYLVGLLRDGMSNYEKIAGISALALTALALCSMYFYLRRFGKGGSLLNIEYSFQQGKTGFDRFMRAMSAFGRRDLFALIFFGLGVIGQLRLALIYIGVLTAALFGFSIHAHLTASRKRRQAA